MTNKDKALALINTFATGDTDVAKNLLAEGYIQHNLAYGTDRDAFLGSVTYLVSAPVKTTVNNIRAFEDGDKVFLQTVYNFAGAEPNPSGRTQIDGTMEKELVNAEETRKIVSAFVGDVLRGEHPEKLTSYFDGDTYIQHNTGIADGLSGLGAALEALGKQGIQMIYDQTYQILADGNYGLAVSEGSFGGAHTSYYDLFRVENGKIVEHFN